VCANATSSSLFLSQSPVNNWIGADETSSLFALTPDYYNPECAEGNPSIGINESSAVGFFTVFFIDDPASEWLQVELNEPLVAGQQYCISFFAFSYSEVGTPGDGLDVALLDSPINQTPAEDGPNPTFFTPIYSNPQGSFIPQSPVEFSFTYCALGGEQWLAFGNQNADQTTLDGPGTQAYVVLDNVNLRESCDQVPDEFTIEATASLLGCDECSELLAVDADGLSLEVDWSDGLGSDISTIEVCPSETTTYSAMLSGVTCEGDEITVTEDITIEVDCDNALAVSLEGGTICLGESFMLEAIVEGGSLPYSYSWSPGSNEESNYTVSPDQSTLYTLVVTDAEGNSAEASAEINVISLTLEVDLGNDRFICPDDTITLDADVGDDLDYQWNFGSTDPVLDITEGGTYIVTVETPCSVLSDTVVIAEVLFDLNYQEVFVACQGDEVQIGPAEGEGYAVTWTNAETNGRRTVTESDIYTGLLTSEWCPSSIPFAVEVEFLNCDCDIFVPNAFTPDSDGINDVFKVVTNCEIETYSLLIYNRWGQEVFSSSSADDVWTGNSQGGGYYVPNSVYTY
jgi:gliding motility-associated-like protein